MVLDIDKVCRLCLELSSNSLFFSEKSSGHQTSLNDELISRIFECTALKVAAGDGLPESVCESCVRLVDKFTLFRKMCWEVDDKLRQYLFSVKDDMQSECLSSSNPVRLDSDQLKLPLEAKNSWKCDEMQIKGEQETSDDDTTNGNDFDNDDSDEDYLPRGSKSAAKSSKPNYSCDNCNETFRKPSELKSHLEVEHGKIKRTRPVLTCSYCNKLFKQLKRYKDHLKTHELPEEKGHTEESQRAANESDSEPANQRPNGENVSENGRRLSLKNEGDSSSGKKKKSRKAYECEYCDQVFHSYAKFTQHELTHTGEKKYNCSDCSRSFTHKHSLIGHIKERHTGEVNFTCEVCGRGFVHQSTFIIHKKTHSTEKPLKCPDCDKCFTQMKNLRVHRQIHSASRSHTCQVCGKSFNFMKTLKVHLILHSGEKPYVCTYCGKAFAQSAPLKTHTRIHTGEKPYQCTICPLRFSTNNSLKSHILKHSGEAPFVCKVCNKGFSRKKDMVAHQEETHCVYVGLPGQPISMPAMPQQSSMPLAPIVHQNSVHTLTPLTPLPSMLIVPEIVSDRVSEHVITLQSPPPLAPLSHPLAPPHHQNHIGHHLVNQLHPVSHPHHAAAHQPAQLQHCMPTTAGHYPTPTPTHRPDLPGTG